MNGKQKGDVSTDPNCCHGQAISLRIIKMAEKPVVESSKCSSKVFTEAGEARLEFFDCNVEHCFWSK